MEKHLDHGEGIANFVSNFGGEQAKHGKFFVGAKLFLDVDDALVEAGFFDGDAGKLREGGEDADFFVGKIVRLGGVDVEGADGGPAREQWNAQQRDELFAAGDFDVLVAGRNLNVVNLQR